MKKFSDSLGRGWMSGCCLLLAVGVSAAEEDVSAEAERRAVCASIPAEVLYVCRPQYPHDHHNTATLFQCGEVNAAKYRSQGSLKAWDPRTGRTRTLVPERRGRTIRDPEVSHDGKTIVFSMRNNAAEDYHIWTVRADGTGLKQLTRASGVSDIDPVWLSDGGIVFSSTREPKYCMCNRHIMANLYRMEADGANIHQIGRSTLFEGHPCLLPDGRILYDRWEYVDRNFGDAQGLWTCNPDGTAHAIWWGNNTTSPGGVISARPIPGEPSKVIAVLTSCHDRPWGALGLIDRAKGVDGREPVLRTWPASFRARIHTDGEDFDSTRKTIKLKYADPFPIDAKRFLCARQEPSGKTMAVYYLDLDGREIELFRDGAGCHSPVLLRAHEKPPVIPVRRTYDDPHAPGTFYVQNVYVGTHMKGVKPGSVKALRIVESPEKRNWTGPRGWFGHGEMAPAMNWHSFENKRILGTVPVETDGSAYFEVPANTFVYFQALDAKGMMVQSMRSGVYVQPGERYGCVGCHESRVGEVPPVAERPLAVRRAPSKMNGWYGSPRLFSYQREVQPVFTRHCTSCHDYNRDAGRKLDLSGDRGAFFCASYVDLWSRKYITCVGGGRAEIYPAFSWGAHASRLTAKLSGHGGAVLTDEERDRVITWMDLNAPYYPVYESAYPGNPGGRMPLTFKEMQRLEALTGVKIAVRHNARQREQLDFDRPACSRILAGVTNAAQRAEAYALIARGGERLRKTPRGDTVEGFVPCATDRARDARYRRRAAEERRVYEAIRTGRKVYDVSEKKTVSEDAGFTACVRPPDPAVHAVDKRAVTMVSSIAVASNGRLWATWYAGITPGEDQNNYSVLATSEDDGKTWKEIYVADPDGRGPWRAFDPEVWIAPDGALHWTWTNRRLRDVKTDVLMRVVVKDARRVPSRVPEARRISRGVMMCKPIVLRDGAWAFPVAHWRETPSSCLYASTDNGVTFECRGGASIPESDYNCDEHMFVEKRNGDIVCYARAKSGIRESVSRDGGRTWSASVRSKIAHTSSRFFISKLKSGAWLLVKHGALDEAGPRSHLTAYVSDDEGATWTGGLLLEERIRCSYPDAQEADDGRIYLTYDYDRYADRKIYFCTFTEADVRAGRNVSGKVRLRQLISRGTGRLVVEPEYVGKPGRGHQAREAAGDPVLLRTKNGKWWKAQCVANHRALRRRYAVLSVADGKDGPWKDVLVIDPDGNGHRYPDTLRLDEDGSRLHFFYDDRITDRKDGIQRWRITIDAVNVPDPDALPRRWRPEVVFCGEVETEKNGGKK